MVLSALGICDLVWVVMDLCKYGILSSLDGIMGRTMYHAQTHYAITASCINLEI